MASSMSSPGSQRRRRRQPLARSNSSFLGTIRNIVTAPLAWFATTDDHIDPNGKRRRPPTEQHVPDVDSDDDRAYQPAKRIRRDSPSPPSSEPTGYLDPPASAFRPNQQPPSARSASASIPPSYNTRRNNSTVPRASTLTRTMSTDPPSRPFATGPGPRALKRDVSMGSSSFLKPSTRDLSLPPLSTQPSFRLRTSATPQPHPYRDKSEPPPISSLTANPTFVRAPPQTDSLHLAIPSQSSVTLGSLVESARSTRSPSRQHSALFENKVEQRSVSPRPISAIEKALHELDIYKTPLIPTRLRSSGTPGPSSDMFKSRRASGLVLIQGDKHSERLGRKSKKEAPVANETKPYAGRGGMKKLLAKRKQEVEEEEVEDDRVRGKKKAEEVDREDDMVEDRPRPEREVEKPVRIVQRVPSLPPVDAAPGPALSLRVGRNKISRNHIARPAARPMRTKFSAAYDDDDAMDDDSEEVKRKMEMEELEEAAKRAPEFKVPANFSFAAEVAPIKHDLANAKEPPITSLPFSFAKPATPAPMTTQPSAAASSFFGPLAPAPPIITQAQSAVVPVAKPTLPVLDPEAPKPAPVEAPPPPTTNGSGIPNFFASSSVLAQPLSVPSTPPLVISQSESALTTTTQNAGTNAAPPPAVNGFSLTPSRPVKDSENPLWEGESKKEIVPTPAPLFSGFGQAGSGSSISAATSAPVPSFSVFGAAAEKKKADVTPANFFGTTPSSAAPSSTTAESKPAFSFGADVPKSSSTLAPVSSSTTMGSTSIFGSKPSGSLFTTEAPKASAPTGFSFSQPPAESAKPGFSFGEPSQAASKPAETVAPASASGFSFGQSQTAATTTDAAKPPSLFGSGFGSTNAESSKSLFGPGTGGGFGFKPVEPKATSAAATTTPFSFGAAPSTPPGDTKKNAFGFGATASTTPAAPAPASIGFSFSNGSDAGQTQAPKPGFTFGQPVGVMPPARPATPPKEVGSQEISMDESPTREAQQMNNNHKLADRPTLGVGGAGFSFGTGFGGQTQTNGGFSFGATTSSSNPFAAKKPEENKSAFGGFGQATAATPTSTAPPFAFGQPAQDNKEAARPSTPGGFSFGATSSSTGFAFGAQPASTTSTLFGQPSNSSAPNSPSTFGQSQTNSPFSFGAPLPSVTNAFTFGSSQPASPAGGNVSLPTPATPGGFGGGFGQAQAPTGTPFGAAASPATPGGGGALFTIGSAPAPPAGVGAGAPGPRQIRKLPTRRGGAKR